MAGDAGGPQGVWDWALRGRRGLRRPWTAAIAWPLATVTAAIGLVRSFGMESGIPLVQLVAFTPYLAAASIVAAVLAGLTRRAVATAVTAVAVLALVLAVAPRVAGSPATADGPPLVVMAVNMRRGGADTESIVELVRSAEVDVLTVQEITAEAEADLLAAGLGETLPHRESHPAPGSSGSAVFSRLPLTGGGRHGDDRWWNQAYATVTLPTGDQFVVESVHPTPPIGDVDRWAAELRIQVRGDAPGPPRILAGDFNATLDHRALRDVLATGYRDAADEVGAGLVPTWPFYGQRSRLTPKITIDHILVPGGIAVRDFQAVTIPGTDHRAIIATLVLTR